MLWVLVGFLGLCGAFYAYAWWEGRPEPEAETADPVAEAGD